MSPTAAPRLDRQKLRVLLEPVVEQAGAELEEVTEQRAGSRRLIRVVVDRDGGVSMDDVAEVTRAVSDALDGYPAMGDTAYVLEVTSPGIDRPLSTPKHWRRARGRLVKATLKAGGEVVGRVADCDERAAILLVGEHEKERSVPYAQIAKARMQVEFNRAADEALEDEALEDEAPDDDALGDQEPHDDDARDDES